MQIVIQSVLQAIVQLSDAAIVRILVKTVLLTVFAFIALGFALWWAIERWIVSILPSDYSGSLAGIIALSVGILAAWLLFRVVAVGVLQLFADEVIAAVELKHYPEAAAAAHPLPFSKDLGNSLRGIGRTMGVNLLALPLVIALVVTGIGPAIALITLNGWLLGRELTDMAWLRHCKEAPEANPVNKSTRFLLGTIIALLMLLPFAGLIAPIIGAAAGTHLVHRALQQR